jgi:F0F1-type ATP synthase delta subunit
MTTKEYAKAIYSIFEESPRADLGKDFVRYLERRGKLALLPTLIYELEKMVHNDARKKTCEVVVASESSLHSSELHAKSFLREHGGQTEGWTFEHRIDPSLIGGYIVRTPERELDMSDKGGLYRLYERLRSTT